MYACGIAKKKVQQKHKQITELNKTKNSQSWRHEKVQHREGKYCTTELVLSYNYMQLSMLWFIMIFEQHYGD